MAEDRQGPCSAVEGGGSRARTVEVDDDHDGQRVDNFLIARLKGVPRSRVYRALRSGEVRVNGSRCKASRALRKGDLVRIPPVRQSSRDTGRGAAKHAPDTIPVLFEDEHLVIVDKPSGMPVHAGTGSSFGLIDVMRERHTDRAFLELAHRLDRQTSGCLVLAGSRQSLLGIQKQFQAGMRKHYLALARGQWSGGRVESPLLRLRTRDERKVVVDQAGQAARTDFSARMHYRACTLMAVRLYTGRMHQIRVHAASEGHPLAGDRVYGDFEFNRKLGELGLRRLFLHAERLRFSHPVTGERIEVYAPLPGKLASLLSRLQCDDA